MTSRFARATCGAAVFFLVGGLAAAVPAGAHELRTSQRERSHIVARARSVIGTPYSYGGGSPGGFDCSGLTSWVFSGHGASLPRTSAGQFSLGDRAGYRRIRSREALKKGDLVFHRTTSAHVGHVGIYVGGGRFISATSSEGVQVRSLYDPYYWGARWVGGVRLPATAPDSRGSAQAKASTKGKAPRRDSPSKARAAERNPQAGSDEPQKRTKGKANRSSTVRYRPEEWRPHGRRGRR